MKRLVNDIGTAKAISILYNQHVAQKQLILWTILKQQHPKLATMVWETPELIEAILSPAGIGEEYKEVLNKAEIRHLFEFKMPNKTIKLDLEFLQRIKFQYTEPS